MDMWAPRGQPGAIRCAATFAGGSDTRVRKDRE